VESEPLVRTFTTKPLPPTNFKINMDNDMEIGWTMSQTPRVM
jgi:hypothetical protein